MSLPNTAMTIHHVMSTPIYYLVLLLTPVLALLPRMLVRAMKNTLQPSDDVAMQVEIRNDKKRGEKLLVSWSTRSTSSSSIFR